MFRPILTKALYKEHKGAGGRPRFDPVMMLKILILQRYYNLSDEQKQSNTEKSKVRVRVEHVFGYMKSTMHRTSSKYIGLERASACMVLMNLTYNMCRYEYLTRAKN